MRSKDSYPQLMIFKEKYGDSVYLLQSSADAPRIAVAKIRERAELGYYYELDVAKLEAERDQAVEKFIAKCGLDLVIAPRTVEALRAIQGSDEERAAQLLGVDAAAFAAYPENLKTQALEGALRFEVGLPRVLANHQDEISDAKFIGLILSSADADTLTIQQRNRRHNLALWILEARGDHEYEGFEFESPFLAPTAEEVEASRVAS